MNHFDEMTGLLYLEGQIDADRAREVSAHLASCDSCRELLRALERESVWLREALTAEEEPIPARVIATRKRASAYWGWIVVFGLGMAGAFTLWTEVVEPWLTQAAQAGFTQGSLLTMIFFTGAFWKGWDAMRSLMEFSAVATLAAVAIWLLRKQWQRFTTIAFVMGALICALALPPSAAAADIEHGDPSYTLPAGQEVKSDLIVAANRTRIDGDVDGDLIVWSDHVIVNGHVKGDIISFADELRVNGTVDGNVRCFSESVTLSGSVGRNVMAWVNEFDLDQGAKIGGSLTLGATEAELSGSVGGDLLALVRTLEINGSLGRDVRIRGQRLKIGPTAQIQGRTKYTGWHQPEILSGAKLGPIDVAIKGPGPDYASPSYYWHQTLYWGASFLFGLVLLLIAPGFFFDAEQACKRVGPALGFGVLFLFATPIAAVIACATIVGLGIGISAVLLYVIAVYSTQVFVGSWIGEKLLGAGAGVGLAVGRLALGLAILRVLRMIPYAGLLIGAIVVIWGMGALVLALHRKMRPQLAPAV
ncbi:MAG: polymer-forming cytoskeletal protein [Candidatus Acidiferrales bacterium]|jgi:cytoskeletal protein CcmA (bactofilin family)